MRIKSLQLYPKIQHAFSDLINILIFGYLPSGVKLNLVAIKDRYDKASAIRNKR